MEELYTGQILKCKYRGYVTVVSIDVHGFEVKHGEIRYSQKYEDLGSILQLVKDTNNEQNDTTKSEITEVYKELTYDKEIMMFLQSGDKSERVRKTHDYRHESSVLSEIVNKLNLIKNKLINQIHDLNVEKSECTKNYYPDIQKKSSAMNSIKMKNVEKGKLEKIINEPYFGRMDLINNNEVSTLYIGEDAFEIDNDLVTYSWNSKVGLAFYKKDQISIEQDGKKSELKLRRRIEIKNAKLLSFIDEYVKGGENSLVTDPFLHELLLEKKNDRKFTDIIRTIQSNQADIISLPYNENIIVQGCAGSGKTMIMMHRLSHLLYESYLSVKDIMIITLNSILNNELSDLANRLEVGDIKRYTLERFFNEIFKKYGIHIPSYQIDCCYDNPQTDFIEFAENLYKKYYEDFLVLIAIEKIQLVASRLGIVYFPNYESKDYIDQIKSQIDSIRQENNRCNELIKKHNERIKRFESIEISAKHIEQYKPSNRIEYNECINKMKKEIDEKNEDYYRSIQFLTQSKERIIKLIADELSLLESELSNFSYVKRLLANKERRRIEELKKEIVTIEVEQERSKFEKQLEHQNVLRILQNKLDNLTKSKNALELEIMNLIDHRIQLKNKRLSSNEIIILNKSYDMINKGVVNFCLNRLNEERAAVYIGKSKDESRRLMTAMALVFLICNKGKLISNKLICIDEGQDISSIELEILKRLNKDAVLNIYGDINQRTSGGVIDTNWDKVKLLLKSAYYELRENYRNTKNICDYVSEKTNIESLAIGSVGTDVIEVAQIEDLSDINIINTVVILKNEKYLSDCTKYIDKNINYVNSDTSKYVEGKLNVYNVKFVKGLEFIDTVVITDSMSNQEKYIAFTRALNSMKVVSAI